MISLLRGKLSKVLSRFGRLLSVLKLRRLNFFPGSFLFGIDVLVSWKFFNKFSKSSGAKCTSEMRISSEVTQQIVCLSGKGRNIKMHIYRWKNEVNFFFSFTSIETLKFGFPASSKRFSQRPLCNSRTFLQFLCLLLLAIIK